MPNYTVYKNNLKAVLDADDSEIESWITVNGNHIPVKKGQSKEEAVKSFIEKKGGKESTKVNITKKGITEKYENVAGKRDALIKELKNKDLTPQERYNKEREKSKLEKLMVSESEKSTTERRQAELAKERGESVKYSGGENKTRGRDKDLDY